MNKRKLIISLAGLVVLGLAFGGAALLNNKGPEEPLAEIEKPAVVVRTVKVQNGTQQATIKITGRVIAAEQVDLYAEVTGVASYGTRPFKTGNAFRKGEVLLRLDSRELSSALASARSQFMATLARTLPDLKLDYPGAYPAWKQYLLDLQKTSSTAALPEVDNEQMKLFLTGRNIYSSWYSIREMETRLSKFTLRAPFDGTLTDARVNQGALVRVGQSLGQFNRSNSYELEASVPPAHLKYLKVGETFGFRQVNGEDRYFGDVVRINERVDPTTQTVRVYFDLAGATLRSGLYLEGEIEAEEVADAMRLPIQALVENTAVYIVEEGKARRFDVQVVSMEADTFIAKGLPDGAVVITDKKNGAFEGSKVITES